MKVYALAVGEYSDYGILAIFSTRECADAAVEDMKRAYAQHIDAIDSLDSNDWTSETYNDPRIEEYELDPEPTRIKFYCVTVGENGQETNRNERMRFMWEHDARTEGYVNWAYAASTRSYDVALKAARDALAKAKTRKAGLA